MPDKLRVHVDGASLPLPKPLVPRVDGVRPPPPLPTEPKAQPPMRAPPKADKGQDPFYLSFLFLGDLFHTHRYLRQFISEF